MSFGCDGGQVRSAGLYEEPVPPRAREIYFRLCLGAGKEEDEQRADDLQLSSSVQSRFRSRARAKRGEPIRPKQKLWVTSPSFNKQIKN